MQILKRIIQVVTRIMKKMRHSAMIDDKNGGQAMLL